MKSIFILQLSLRKFYGKDPNKQGLFDTDALWITHSARMLERTNFLPTKLCDHVTDGIYSVGFFWPEPSQL